MKGFSQKDFDTFLIDGLEARMTAIQERIQPKFQAIGNELVDDLSAHLGNEVYLHIAKHARRTVNPPNDTWLAIADNKRGYKKHPHFQVGLFDDHLFIWLALIYELDGKEKIAASYLKDINQLKQLPEDFVVSLDHMKKDSISIGDLAEKHFIRFRDVKKAEFLIGRHLQSDDKRTKNGELLMETIKDTFHTLIPLYQQAMQVRNQ
ncbi:DUF1054 domain-containing protein [Ornithinibacillus gellani]|uniref:YktB family protein n=1 Tax=Ornithinibacillus gellani TaxID=2293253 RepID=UPI000F49D2B1|nr:DUF1054 domain-containing protein [Ornithinibacillus gellani]TQS75697.1 DUF1054 domain-containing protein [Ornithinibacillus gellani]